MFSPTRDDEYRKTLRGYVTSSLHLHLRSFLAGGVMVLLVFPLVFKFRTVGQSLQKTPITMKVKKSAASGQCLNLELNQDMDSLIASARQIFITMPAKASGTSMRRFTSQCMNNETKSTDILENGDFNKDYLMSKVHADAIVTSHLYTNKGLIRLAKYPSRETLIIQIHREERNRIDSAVKHLMTSYCAGSRSSVGRTLNIKRNGTECVLNEGPVVDVIAERRSEVHMSTHDVLNCESYKALQENDPQLVIINYKQVDKLQALLAKHHCPQLELPVHANIAAAKRINVFLKPKRGGKISIDDWLREKGPSLEVALDLRKKASCQAKTMHMEDELFACPDETLRVTTKSIQDW